LRLSFARFTVTNGFAMFQAALVQRLMLQLEGSKRGVVGLVKEIAAANSSVDSVPLNRAKLTRIVNGLPVTFSYDELNALDVYLRTLGTPISTLFDRTDIVKDLAAQGNVYFLLGSKPLAERTNFISQWDLRSMADLLRLVDRARSGVQHDVVDILLRNSAQVRGTPLSEMSLEPWYDLLGQKDGPSLVAIGSPRANHASEVMLAMMFGREPFRPYRASERRAKLPFHFSWTNQSFTDLPSFIGVTEALTKTGAHASLYIGDRPYAVHDESPRTEYGVIVAQSRPNGRVWLVVAGLSGPATQAATGMLSKFSIDPPLYREGKRPSVAWAAVEAQVQIGSDAPGEDRSMKTFSYLVEPTIWTADVTR
jgi:hypothetical protein